MGLAGYGCSGASGRRQHELLQRGRGRREAEADGGAEWPKARASAVGGGRARPGVGEGEGEGEREWEAGRRQMPWGEGPARRAAAARGGPDGGDAAAPTR